jgi:hypothetical protein
MKHFELTRTVKWYAAALCAVTLSSWIFHPFGRVKNAYSADAVFSGASIDAGTRTIISRSCLNCHSDKTEWPWYSYIAPVSWMIERDVQRARSHMNLSRWQAYKAQQQVLLLGEMEMLTRSRLMPLSRYLLLHPEARLSDADLDQISKWTHAERARLHSAIAHVQIADRHY